ncbi:DUF1934 domain-containing protein [Caldalkalibacillus salinus]|uniref:DUF1934 domain-containing protein n=1 Tax=Caldalkalibacillus salinus TaxID=2803787 RepID=UPI00192199DD|nr:DUF1934 domain-containing protein [Caldalkalibacillus salinus]
MAKPFAKIEVLIDVTTISKENKTKDTQTQRQGYLYHDGDQEYILRYEEQIGDEGEDQPTHTTLKIKGEEIKLIRHGTVQMNHTYVKGKTTEGRYHTPYGMMPMETKTTKLTFNWNEDTGQLTLGYDLKMNNAFIDHLTLDIRIHKQ